MQAPDVGTRFRMFMTNSDIFEGEVAVPTVTSSSPLLLASLELSGTKVYEP